jgi:hypothetical protein
MTTLGDFAAYLLMLLCVGAVVIAVESLSRRN